VNVLQGVPVATVKVNALVVTVAAVPLNWAAVPVNSKPCDAISPWAVAFTVAVCPLHVMLVIVAAERD